MEITISKKNYLAHLNKDNKVELIQGSGIAVVDEKYNHLIFDEGRRLPIHPDKVKELKTYREGLRSELKEYFLRLLKGEEKLMLIPTGDPEDYPHIITSETLLTRGHESVKFAEVLASVFLPKSVEKIGVKGWSKTLQDVERDSGKLKVPEITLRELVRGMT